MLILPWDSFTRIAAFSSGDTDHFCKEEEEEGKVILT